MTGTEPGIEWSQNATSEKSQFRSRSLPGFTLKSKCVTAILTASKPGSHWVMSTSINCEHCQHMQGLAAWKELWFVHCGSVLFSPKIWSSVTRDEKCFGQNNTNDKDPRKDTEDNCSNINPASWVGLAACAGLCGTANAFRVAGLSWTKSFLHQRPVLQLRPTPSNTYYKIKSHMATKVWVFFGPGVPSFPDWNNSIIMLVTQALLTPWKRNHIIERKEEL